jgi:aryl-alcohol dehydrogenase-like predicted oxidoreductase
VLFVAYSPLGRGFLTGRIRSRDDLAESDYRRQSPRFSEENFAKNLQLVSEVEKLADAKGCTAAQLALAWVLSRGDHVVAIPGTRNRELLEQNAGSADVSLTAGELAALDAILPPDAPVGGRYDAGGMASVDG